MLEQSEIYEAIPQALRQAVLPWLGPRQEGKVRDCFTEDGERLLVTTDRVSAFDRVVGAVPFRGQVLNQLSQWWFEQTSDIVDNHLKSVPDPNVTIAHDAQPLPVEVIVRGYITGVTSTALWTLYSQGVDRPYGLELPAGLKKNDALPTPVITPTTKATGGAHDERLTSQQVVDQGLVEAELWQRVQQVALQLFERGQQIAERAGLILVDTKYEFGLIGDKLVLIDEVHTPDSSRYWVVESYNKVRGTDQEPERFDKELLRAWLLQQGYRGEGKPPRLPDDFVVTLAERYIAVYERLTGTAFEPGALPVLERIKTALSGPC